MILRHGEYGIALDHACSVSDGSLPVCVLVNRLRKLTIREEVILFTHAAY